MKTRAYLCRHPAALWRKSMQAYEQAVRHTTLDKLGLAFPRVIGDKKKEFEAARAALENQTG
jgi:hypothetical protein